MKQKFMNVNFHQKTLSTIATVNKVLGEYTAMGYVVTLRQLYYQLVARNLIENSDAAYKKLGDTVNDARLAGLVDWDAICDLGREVVSQPAWDGPTDILRSAADSFALDKWQSQPNHLVVMVEKQALEGVLIPVCRRHQVCFTANKGYSSASVLYELGQKLAGLHAQGKKIHVLYLGDHDPSGLDMTRDVRDRLCLFSGLPDVQVHRLALNMEQVEEMKPPENTAKTKDTRFPDYYRRYGNASWELDAIEPSRLDELVSDAIVSLRDSALWQTAAEREQEMRDELVAIADGYGKP